MNGSFASARRASIAVVLAICISDSSPSCMRAPPVAVMQMNGTFCSIAVCDAAHEALAHDRAHRAAHELELEAGDHDRHRADRAAHHDQRVGLAGLLHRLLQAVGYLRLSLNLSASTGSTSWPIS